LNDKNQGAARYIMNSGRTRFFQSPVQRSMFKTVLMVCVLQLLLSACSQDDTALGKNRIYVIKFPHVTAPATPKGQGAEKLSRLVDERLGGRVRLEVYPSGQLMNADDSIEALAFGEVQMIAMSLSKFDRLTPKFQVFDLPFLFKDLEEVEAFQQSGTGRDLLLTIEHKGFLGLGFWHNGMKQFGGPVPMNKPSDASGLNFRIMESDVLQAQILAMGAVPQKMAFGEVYQALQSGAIDAQENTWSNIWSQKFFEVQPYITESNHGYLGYLLAVNTEFWESLPDDIRVELNAIVAEVTAEVNQQANAINQEHKSMILATGKSELVELSEEDISNWRAMMRPVWDQFAEDIGDEIMNATAFDKDID
jgi:C4-dicarboxylate-binding protein DctP